MTLFSTISRKLDSWFGGFGIFGFEVSLNEEYNLEIQLLYCIICLVLELGSQDTSSRTRH